VEWQRARKQGAHPIFSYVGGTALCYNLLLVFPAFHHSAIPACCYIIFTLALLLSLRGQQECSHTMMQKLKPDL